MKRLFNILLFTRFTNKETGGYMKQNRSLYSIYIVRAKPFLNFYIFFIMIFVNIFGIDESTID